MTEKCNATIQELLTTSIEGTNWKRLIEIAAVIGNTWQRETIPYSQSVHYKLRVSEDVTFDLSHNEFDGWLVSIEKEARGSRWFVPFAKLHKKLSEEQATAVGTILLSQLVFAASLTLTAQAVKSTVSLDENGAQEMQDITCFPLVPFDSLDVRGRNSLMMPVNAVIAVISGRVRIGYIAMRHFTQVELPHDPRATNEREMIKSALRLLDERCSVLRVPTS